MAYRAGKVVKAGAGNMQSVDTEGVVVGLTVADLCVCGVQGGPGDLPHLNEPREHEGCVGVIHHGQHRELAVPLGVDRCGTHGTRREHGQKIRASTEDNDKTD